MSKKCIQAVYHLSQNGIIRKAIIGNASHPDIIAHTENIVKQYTNTYDIELHEVRETFCNRMLCKYVCNFVYSEGYDENGKHSFKIEKKM